MFVWLCCRAGTLAEAVVNGDELDTCIGNELSPMKVELLSFCCILSKGDGENMHCSEFIPENVNSNL